MSQPECSHKAKGPHCPKLWKGQLYPHSLRKLFCSFRQNELKQDGWMEAGKTERQAVEIKGGKHKPRKILMYTLIDECSHLLIADTTQRALDGQIFHPLF